MDGVWFVPVFDLVFVPCAAVAASSSREVESSNDAIVGVVEACSVVSIVAFVAAGRFFREDVNWAWDLFVVVLAALVVDLSACAASVADSTSWMYRPSAIACFVSLSCLPICWMT